MTKTFRFDPTASGTRRKQDAPPPRDGNDYVAGVPLARVIPRLLEERPELVMLTNPRSVAAERFHRLASTLTSRTGDSGLVLVVTSAIPNEGKTTIAMNLGLTFASDAEGETLIVDGDLRRPAIHNWLKQPPALGVNEVLSGKTDVEHAILKLKNSKLKVLPAGSAYGDAVELLGSADFKDLITALRQRFRQIIIDTPPILPFTDAQVLTRLATGALIVTRSRHIAKKSFTRAISLLDSDKILGVVLNQHLPSIADGGVNRDTYYYADYYDREDRKK